MFDYTWLTDLMIEFGQQYPAYFESSFAHQIQALIPPLWFVFLLAIINVYCDGGYEK